MFCSLRLPCSGQSAGVHGGRLLGSVAEVRSGPVVFKEARAKNNIKGGITL